MKHKAKTKAGLTSQGQVLSMLTGWPGRQGWLQHTGRREHSVRCWPVWVITCRPPHTLAAQRLHRSSPQIESRQLSCSMPAWGAMHLIEIVIGSHQHDPAFQPAARRSGLADTTMATADSSLVHMQANRGADRLASRLHKAPERLCMWTKADKIVKMTIHQVN